jgi:tRNA threonylcarbamoyladenosine biosynthesis protein TsaB
MKILALDSSSGVASVAVTEDNKLLGETSLQIGSKHSESLLPMARSLLQVIGISLADIDRFAVTVGPGSFTGVRIGVSLLKGLAFGSGRLCSGVSSLEALAYNLRDVNGTICAVMDARRNQLYNAFFDIQNGVVSRLTADSLDPAEKIEDQRNEMGQKVWLVGDGYEAMSQKIGNKAFVTPVPLRLASAASVAWAALSDSENWVEDVRLAPVYLRASQAEQERDGKINQSV